ncbi:uncharacterized protein LOC111338820 [Stylophora pistillata]|uniref:uncharacterized protein LOC111338820 n=1 Tax=Stylophora pistillata TaxID=50429 RepID=UPI000C04FC1B|nr:uncharacterized protein LOC111338820 [Stylophora pistillata]
MAKRLRRLKERFLSKIHRPFGYKRVQKNTDSIECSESRANCETTSKREILYSSLGADQETHNTPECSRLQSKGISPRVSACKENGTVEITEEDEVEELSQIKQTQSQRRRRSSAFQRLVSWVKPENRRHAICEQMEREIETQGVSLRQYRKFLATTYILHDLKML